MTQYLLIEVLFVIVTITCLFIGRKIWGKSITFWVYFGWVILVNVLLCVFLYFQIVGN